MSKLLLAVVAQQTQDIAELKLRVADLESQMDSLLAEGEEDEASHYLDGTPIQ